MVPDSLHEMVRALQWASGPVYKLAQTGEDSDAAEVTFCPSPVHHDLLEGAESTRPPAVCHDASLKAVPLRLSVVEMPCSASCPILGHSVVKLGM